MSQITRKKKFPEIQYTTESNKNTVDNNKKVYFKLQYLGSFWKLKQICDKYC